MACWEFYRLVILSRLCVLSASSPIRDRWQNDTAPRRGRRRASQLSHGVSYASDGMARHTAAVTQHCVITITHPVSPSRTATINKMATPH